MNVDDTECSHSVLGWNTIVSVNKVLCILGDGRNRFTSHYGQDNVVVLEFFKHFDT